MAFNIDNYRRDLEQALTHLQPQIDSGRIIGNDRGQFLVVDKGDRGIEICGGEEGTVVVDPAIAGELQGETVCPSLDHALDAAIRWLNGANRDSLLENAV